MNYIIFINRLNFKPCKYHWTLLANREKISPRETFRPMKRLVMNFFNVSTMSPLVS